MASVPRNRRDVKEHDLICERPAHVGAEGRALHLDLLLSSPAQSVAIELQHKTRGLSVKLSGEGYRLKDQATQDLGRHDSIEDVHRIERIVESRPGTSGFAILLTNDSSYWKRPKDPNSVDATFRVHEGRSVSGQLSWAPRAAPGTMRSREEPILLTGTYDARWQNYCEVASTACGKFRILVYSATTIVAA